MDLTTKYKHFKPKLSVPALNNKNKIYEGN